MDPRRKRSPDLILFFENQTKWTAWLEEHHSASGGLWLRLAKKSSAVKSLTYQEALESALCYGWIDGQKKGESDDTWLQRFLPRSKKSIWSKINREKALALVEAGRMKPAGLREVDRAKSDGRWEQAYDSPSTATPTEDFEAALNTSPRAKAAFASLDRSNRYAFLFRIQTAKRPETRAKRIALFVKMLENGEKIHP
ncbi:MAG TPA: YdeI/OmpD-associated family protein [Bryobacteraceae bacterium]|nr:YdeI/OmpD-associated family protein [Bryobacteraceae bacterium]